MPDSNSPADPGTPPIKSIAFKNYRALRDTTLPLEWFTLIIGPNGSGKSTALGAFSEIAKLSPFENCRSFSAIKDESSPMGAMFEFGTPFDDITAAVSSTLDKNGQRRAHFAVRPDNEPIKQTVAKLLSSVFVCSFHPKSIRQASKVEPSIKLAAEGGALSAVLDRIRDDAPERFAHLNDDLRNWFPEFDTVLFDTQEAGYKSISLRTVRDKVKVPASALSDGTLMALALLTITHLPDPPPVICIEEPDHGLHPRLLREVGEALYRLAHPKDYGDEDRKPVQVIATTHSPFFLDVFRDRLECIVIADKKPNGDATFTRFLDLPNIEEIIGDEPLLSEIWYSGILGGVPAGT